MTDADLAILLRPLMPQVLAAAKAQLRTEVESRIRAEVAREHSEAHSRNFSAESEDSPAFRPAFTAEEVSRFADYFSDDGHGHYPFSIHRHFGLSWRQFADAAGVLRKQVVSGEGKERWAWVKRPENVQPKNVQPKAGADVEAIANFVAPAEPTVGPVRGIATSALWTGTVRDLPAEKFDPAKSPPLVAWTDPADGKHYVIDGHHRLAWAERDGCPRVPVQFVTAGSAEQAKAFGETLNREQSPAIFSAPGPPPHPGWEWHEETHHWRNPANWGESEPHAESRPSSRQKVTPDTMDAEYATAMKAVADSIAHDLAAGDAELRANPGLVAKVKDLALTATVKAYQVALDITHSKWTARLASLLEDVFDVPSDLGKLGYNPNTSSGTANPTVLDPVKSATGVSGHLVASIASKVIVKALYWLKGKLKGAPTTMADEGDWKAPVADLLANLFDAVHESLGLPPVDRGAVQAAAAIPMAAKVQESAAAPFADGVEEIANFAAGGTHSPYGGVTIGGKHYPGGEFIPGSALAGATESEKAKVDGSGVVSRGEGDKPFPQFVEGITAREGGTVSGPQTAAQITPSEADHATAAQWVSATDLAEPQKKEYTTHIATALAGIPESVRKSVHDTMALRKFTPTFHANPEALNAAATAITGKRQSGLMGFVHDRGGSAIGVHLDGGANPVGTAVHELWHVADDGYHSQTPAWKAAWKSEIQGARANNILSRYAMTNEAEGLAEFGRMVALKGAEEVKRRYPKCYTALTKQGLLT